MTKRKPGRPKKPAVATINEVDEVVKYWKAVIEIKDELITELERNITDAYKEQQQIINEIEDSLGAMLFHCDKVEKNTGKLSVDDVHYCVNLLTRTISHKFKSSSED
jgi:hypothetical protein